MKGLLSVCFGTSYADTRVKTIDAIEQRLRAEFPDHVFYSAWTSGRIVKKVRDLRGEHHDTLDEAFARLDSEGVDELLVSTMCLMQGNEMEKASCAARAWLAGGEGRKLHLADPLLADEKGCRSMAEAVCAEFSELPDEDALLLMGHGSQDAPKVRDGRPFDANAVYAQVQDAMHALGRNRFFIGTVEGTPTFDDALRLLETCGAARVNVAPLMIVAGDHAKNDLAGGEDSWKCRLEERGFEVQAVLRGLGEYPAVQQLVCERARAARELELERG